MFKNKSILYIVHSYRDFTKEQIELLSESFEMVYVIVRYKPIMEWFRLFNLDEINFHIKKYSINLVNLPHNVKIFTSNLFYPPGRFFYKYIGKQHLEKVKNVINDNNIKFDIIHGHFGWSAGYVAVELGKIYKKPSIVTFHGEDAYELPFKSLKWKNIFENILKDATHIITVSNKNKQFLSQLTNKNISVISNGYSDKKFNLKLPEHFDFKKKYNLSDKTKIFINVANLNNYKGHEYLIRAFKQVQLVNENTALFIIGGGHLKNKLTRIVKKLGIKKIFLLGWIPHENISQYLIQSDFFVLSSISEGNPTVMFEALATGLPFLSTDVGGVVDVIEEGVNGFVSKIRDEDELKSIMIKSLYHEWDRDKINKMALDFSWRSISNKILEVYKLYLTN